MIIPTEEGNLEVWEAEKDFVFEVHTGKVPTSLLSIS